MKVPHGIAFIMAECNPTGYLTISFPRARTIDVQKDSYVLSDEKGEPVGLIHGQHIVGYIIMEAVRDPNPKS